jgi:hypothetical protein
MPHNIGAARTAERITKAEAVREIDLMQATRDKPGDRIYKPVKPPPHNFGPPRSAAAARDAAQFHSKFTNYEAHKSVDVATDYYVPRAPHRRVS